MDAWLFPVSITHCPLTSVETVSHPLCSQSQSGVHIHAQHFSFCGFLFVSCSRHLLPETDISLLKPLCLLCFLSEVRIRKPKYHSCLPVKKNIQLCLGFVSVLNPPQSFTSNAHLVARPLLNRCVEPHTERPNGPSFFLPAHRTTQCLHLSFCSHSSKSQKASKDNLKCDNVECLWIFTYFMLIAITPK